MTSVGGGQGTETEGVVDRVLNTWARMKGGKGGGGSRWHRVVAGWISTTRGWGAGA